MVETPEERVRQQLSVALAEGRAVKEKRCLECFHGLEYHWLRGVIENPKTLCAVNGCRCQRGL